LLSEGITLLDDKFFDLDKPCFCYNLFLSSNSEALSSPYLTSIFLLFAPKSKPSFYCLGVNSNFFLTISEP
jgi:hypothetical protein